MIEKCKLCNGKGVLPAPFDFGGLFGGIMRPAPQICAACAGLGFVTRPNA